MATPKNTDRLAQLQAQFAALGCELTSYPPGDSRGPLRLCFYGQVRVFSDVGQAEAFFPMVDGLVTYNNVGVNYAAP